MLGEQHVAGLLADQVDRRGDEEARDVGEDRRVDHPQPLDPAHPEVAVEHRPGVVVAADLGGAARVVAPRVVAHELAQRPAIAYVVAGQQLAAHLDLLQVAHHVSGQLDAVDHAVEVGLPAGRALLEVAEPDVGHLARVGRAQRDGARAVGRVALEHEQRQPVVRGDGVAGVAGVVAVEVDRQGEHDEVGGLARHRRARDDRGQRPVGGVGPASVVGPLLEERVALLAVGRHVERGAGEQRIVLCQLVVHRHLVAVVQVRADAGGVQAHVDAVLLQLLPRPDAGEHQQLRGVVRPARQHDLLAGAHDRPGRLGGCVGGAGGGGVQVRAGEDLHAHGPVALEDHPGRQRAETHLQPVARLALGLLHPLAAAVAVAVAHGDGDERHALEVLRGVARVGVAGERDLLGDAEAVARGALHRADDVEEHRLAAADLRVGAGGPEPAVGAVCRLAVAGGLVVAGQRLGVDPAPGLEPVEQLAHRVRAPARVTGELGEPVPVARVRIDGDQRADRGAAAEGRAARIEHPATLGDVLGVAALLALVVVVPDEEVPPQRGVLAGVRLHDRDRVVRAAVVASGLEQQHRVAGEGEVGGERTAAGARPDHDEVELLGVGGHRAQPWILLIQSRGTRSAGAGTPCASG